MFARSTGFAFCVLVIASAPGRVSAQQVALTVHPIKDGKLYWVEGGGGNSGIVIGDQGVIVVDAKTTADGGRQLLAEVAKLTSIETHSDGDHVNGVKAFPEGIRIIAHANNKAEQQASLLHAIVEVDGGRCRPPVNRLPNQLIAREKVATTINGERFIFYHFGPAHTTGDLVVYLPDEHFAFVGDLITSFIVVHMETLGSLDGWFTTIRNVLRLGASAYLGGHAIQLDTRESLRKRVNDYQAVRDQVDDLVKQGKTLAEVKAAVGDPPQNRIGCRGIPQLSLAEVAYNSRIARNQELK